MSERLQREAAMLAWWCIQRESDERSRRRRRQGKRRRMGEEAGWCEAPAPRLHDQDKRRNHLCVGVGRGRRRGWRGCEGVATSNRQASKTKKLSPGPLSSIFLTQARPAGSRDIARLRSNLSCCAVCPLPASKPLPHCNYQRRPTSTCTGSIGCRRGRAVAFAFSNDHPALQRNPCFVCGKEEGRLTGTIWASTTTPTLTNQDSRPCLYTTLHTQVPAGDGRHVGEAATAAAPSGGRSTEGPSLVGLLHFRVGGDSTRRGQPRTTRSRGSRADLGAAATCARRGL